MTLYRKLVGVALAGLLALAGCGNDSTVQDLRGQIGVIATIVAPAATRDGPDLGRLDPAAAQAMRARLAAAGQPSLLVTSPGQRFAEVMTPYGRNGDVETWTSANRTTISLRNGLLVASRGFGPDLMSSVVPDIAKVSSGVGATGRSFYYLGGADERLVFDFDCTLANLGTENIAILGRSYVTRKVSESCSHPLGSFVNVYWFDNRLNLRQSQQAVTLGMESLLIRRIID